jgi:hypothetical protein
VRGARGAIFFLAAASLLLPTAARTQENRAAFLVMHDDLSYEEALRDTTLAALARAGGIGLMTTPGGDDEPPEAVEALIPPRVALPSLEVLGARPSLAALGRDLRSALAGSTAADTLVVFASPSASDEMRSRGDNVTPVIVAMGDPASLLSEVRPAGGLTSDTTGRDGVVANSDVVPTILAFLGSSLPENTVGSPIRIAGEPPTDLHTRYLEYRQVVGPVGVTVLLVAVASLAASLVLLAGLWSPPRWLLRGVAFLGLTSVAGLVALLPASVLPEYDPPLVFGVVAVVAAAIAVFALWAGRGDPAWAIAVVAGLGLALVVVDGILGWPSGITPMLGGSALDGVRFFGLGNSYAGVVLAGAVLLATRLDPWPGVALIGAAALFAGLPFLGADLGGGVTLVAVAGLWFGLRIRGRLDLGSWLTAGAVAVLGAALLVLAHRVLPAGATHVSRAVQDADGLVGLIEVFGRRLSSNLETTAATPVAWVALLGLPAWLAVAWQRSGPFRPPLDREPAWRDGALALAMGGMIGYVLNDTFGMATVAFLFLSGAMVYPALVARWTSG